MIEDPLGPDEDELAMGEEAACDLVAHMKRIRAASTSFEILDGGTLWKVTVEAQTMGKVNQGTAWMQRSVTVPEGPSSD